MKNEILGLFFEQYKRVDRPRLASILFNIIGTAFMGKPKEEDFPLAYDTEKGRATRREYLRFFYYLPGDRLVRTRFRDKNAIETCGVWNEKFKEAQGRQKQFQWSVLPLFACVAVVGFVSMFQAPNIKAAEMTADQCQTVIREASAWSLLRSPTEKTNLNEDTPACIRKIESENKFVMSESKCNSYVRRTETKNAPAGFERNLNYWCTQTYEAVAKAQQERIKQRNAQ